MVPRFFSGLVIWPKTCRKYESGTRPSLVHHASDLSSRTLVYSYNVTISAKRIIMDSNLRQVFSDNYQTTELLFKVFDQFVWLIAFLEIRQTWFRTNNTHSFSLFFFFFLLQFLFLLFSLRFHFFGHFSLQLLDLGLLSISLRREKVHNRPWLAQP